MTTAIVQHVSFEEMEKMAKVIADAGFFGTKNTNEVLALMLVAQAEGLHPATIAQEYDIISGRPARKTHSVLARFQQAGGKVEWKTLTDTVVIGSFSHASGGTVDIEWTIAQASKIDVWNAKKNTWEKLTERLQWQNYPRAMLRARCIGEGIRAVYPLALGGMLITEEAKDLADTPIDVTPTHVQEEVTVPGPVKKTPPVSDSPTTQPADAAKVDPPKVDAPVQQAATPDPVTAGTENATASEETGQIITPNRVKVMRARMAAANVTEDQIKERFGKPLDQLLLSQSSAIQTFIQNPKG
jgi:hypothetical protein